MYILLRICSFLIDNLNTILLSVLTSVVASFIFWLLTFYISSLKIKFADNIEKSPSLTWSGFYKYRIRMINKGKRNFTEVSITAKLQVIISQEKFQYTLINVGNSNFIPIFYGKKSKNPVSSKGSQTLTIRLSDASRNEFKKSIYSETIQKKAKDQTLSLNDIFNEYGNSAIITIFLFGNDSLTGARRTFVSKEYRVSDIIKGKYSSDNSSLEIETTTDMEHYIFDAHIDSYSLNYTLYCDG